jgi:hypothetical protein
MYVLINSAGQLQAIHELGGLIYQQDKNEVNGAFTALSMQGTLLYTGTEKGKVIDIYIYRLCGCIRFAERDFHKVNKFLR